MRTKLTRLGKAVVVGCVVGSVVTSASAAVSHVRGFFPIVVAAPLDILSSLTGSDDSSTANLQKASQQRRPLKVKIGPVPEYVAVAPIPEPSTGLLLLGGGLVGAIRRPSRGIKSR